MPKTSSLLDDAQYYAPASEGDDEDRSFYDPLADEAVAAPPPPLDDFALLDAPPASTRHQHATRMPEGFDELLESEGVPAAGPVQALRKMNRPLSRPGTGGRPQPRRASSSSPALG